MVRLPSGVVTLQYPGGAKDGQMPCFAFAAMPFFVSSPRFSTQFLAIKTLIPCMNFTCDRDSGERTTFSLTRWISASNSSIVTRSRRLR